MRFDEQFSYFWRKYNNVWIGLITRQDVKLERVNQENLLAMQIFWRKCFLHLLMQWMRWVDFFFYVFNFYCQFSCSNIVLLWFNYFQHMKAKVTHWVSYGTLLGAIRQNTILPWTSDADIVVPSELFSIFDEPTDITNDI